MGFLSSITDTLFGDSGKGASDKQSSENRKNREFIREGIAEARGEISSLFPGIQEARQTGFDRSRDIFSQSVPQQFNAFTQGNQQAQQTTANAPQQQMNARLGQPVDFGFLQPQQSFQPDFSFLQPQQAQPQEQQAQQPSVDLNALIQDPNFLKSLGINFGSGGTGQFNGPGGIF